MEKKFDINDFDLVCDVITEYDQLREEKRTGIDAILLENYKEELSDFDDRCFVYIALALSHLKHQGKVSTKVQKETLSILKSKYFIERFQEAEDEAYFQSFCEWKARLEKDIENGITLVKSVPKKRKRLPRMEEGDVFRLSFDEETQKKYGTILLTVIDYCELFNHKTPIFYLLVTRDSINTVADISIPKTFFLPVSKRFPQYDYRRVLLNRSMEMNLTLTRIGNLPNLLKPMHEYVPEKIEFYSWNYLENIPNEIEMGLKMLRKNFIQ